MKDIITKINEGFETEDNMIVYKGKKQCYAVINTSEYDAPGVAVILEELDKLGELGYKIDKKNVKIDGNLSSLGNFYVDVELYKKVVAKVRVELVSK